MIHTLCTRVYVRVCMYIAYAIRCVLRYAQPPRNYEWFICFLAGISFPDESCMCLYSVVSCGVVRTDIEVSESCKIHNSRAAWMKVVYFNFRGVSK